MVVNDHDVSEFCCMCTSPDGAAALISLCIVGSGSIGQCYRYHCLVALCQAVLHPSVLCGCCCAFQHAVVCSAAAGKPQVGWKPLLCLV